ncbi:hypothetical protein EST38_g11429 [Candolleomyces aberdarensis]|uniref:T6SS Phospholipase effector Tle1-like catalytic domain-containing protein n=1 Tax=Candolleomyces aberdarensis TaxID=2316362 RepID=A0A4Q2D777_9AGAR|nr:hypothetical protein EST38_g11429 [Candolleomyces aberdarensis]
MTSDIRHISEPSACSTASTIVERRELSMDDDSLKTPQTLPPVIPPTHQNRTLVLCFDGTGDQFDDDNSNVVQFVSLLKNDDRYKQLVYYQTGIGTYTAKDRTVSERMSQIHKLLDSMFARTIDAHIMGGYKFLMQNYKPGDKICIFGFSRGAYTARCLAGMLHKVGLLPPSNSEQVPFAYTIYRRVDGHGWDQANEFKRAFSINVDIEFLGVWDTVGSIGFARDELPFSTSDTFIGTYRHAISLDERRAKFQANQWNKPNSVEVKLGTPSTRDRLPTDIKEVWFAGCHSDVGGGSVRNRTRHSLAKIPLRWMVREIFKAKAGILFLTDRLYEIGLDPSTIYPEVLIRPVPLSAEEHNEKHKIRKRSREEMPFRHSISRSKLPITRVSGQPATGPNVMPLTEEHEELMDALSPIYDQMKIKKWWWLLEYIPVPLRRSMKLNYVVPGSTVAIHVLPRPGQKNHWFTEV